ncbi:MAG: hypothetical protein ACREI9_07720 [Nitrospiraceae bacterium]
MMKTLKNLSERASRARAEADEELQKLDNLYRDPSTSEERKKEIKEKINSLISALENKIETERRLRSES